MNTKIKITEEIKKTILNMVYEREGQKMIAIGNCHLDFSKEYILKGFSEKTVRLAWMNGTKQRNVNAAVYRESSDRLSLVAEGWSFIEKLKPLAMGI